MLYTFLLVNGGRPLAEISYAALLGAFAVWGLLMGLAGAAVAWVLRGDRLPEATYEPRPFSPGRIGVATSDSNATTVAIRHPQRVLDEAGGFVGRAGTAAVPKLRIDPPPGRRVPRPRKESA